MPQEEENIRFPACFATLIIFHFLFRSFAENSLNEDKTSVPLQLGVIALHY